jgi:hypothetical protein
MLSTTHMGCYMALMLEHEWYYVRMYVPQATCQHTGEYKVHDLLLSSYLPHLSSVDSTLCLLGMHSSFCCQVAA